MKKTLKIGFFFYFFSLFQVLRADIDKAEKAHFITLSDGAMLYCEDQGHGQPLIFIPGWTGTHLFFEKQIPFFSQGYRVMTFDPRGQGLSPSTLSHNTYEQHGRDLHEFILVTNENEEILLVLFGASRVVIASVTSVAVHSDALLAPKTPA